MIFPLFLSIILAFARLTDCQDCSNVRCPPGTICQAGACQCFGANCPTTTTTTTTTTTSKPTVCPSNPCKNGCQCVESCKHADGYYCKSSLGFVGRHCDIAAPLLTCASSNISISTEAGLLDDLYATSSAITCLYVASSADSLADMERCRVCAPNTFGHYDITIQLPFDRCGIQRTTSNNEAVFAGVLWANLLGAGSFDVPVPVLNFYCRYNKEYSISVPIIPRIESGLVTVKNTMQPRGFLELCKTSESCPAACPPLYLVNSGAVYTISETVHATMSLEAGGLDWYRGGSGTYVVILDELNLACDASRFSDLGSVPLVRAGCETEELTTFLRHDGDTNVVCVSFKVPRLLACPRSTFYIHARLRIVARSLTMKCSTGNGRYAVDVTSNRFRRSTHFATNQTIVSAPIIIIREEAAGKSSSSLFPEIIEVPALKPNDPSLPTDNIDSKDLSTSHMTIIAAVLGGTALLLFVLSLLFCSRDEKN